MGKVKADFWELADEFYNYERPGYIVKPGRSFITIMTGDDLFGFNPLKITVGDVVDYYAYQASSMSGCRTLAGFTSDWRGIDALANECLQWFKFVNVDTLRRLSKQAGMIPRF